MENNRRHWIVLKGFLFFSFLVVSVIFFGQMSVSISRTFYPPCFELCDRKYSGHISDWFRYESSAQGDMVIKGSGILGLWDVSYSWGNWTDLVPDKLRSNHENYRKEQIASNAKSGITLIEYKEIEISGTTFDVEIWQGEVCSEVGKSDEYFCEILLDTVLAGCIRIWFQMLSYTFSDRAEMEKALNRELKAFKKIQLISPLNFDIDLDMRLDQRAYYSCAKKQARWDVGMLKAEIEKRIYYVDESDIFKDLDPVLASRYWGLYQAGNVQQVLDEHNDLQCATYEKRIEGLKNEIARTGFSMNNYLKLRSQYYLDQFTQDDFLNDLNRLEPNNKASLLKQYIKLMHLLGKREKSIIYAYLKNGSLDSIVGARINSDYSTDLYCDEEAARNINKIWDTYFSINLMTQALKTQDLSPEKLEFHRLQETDPFHEYFIFSSCDALGQRHSYYTGFALEPDNKWHQYQTKLPFSFWPDSLRQSGVYGGFVYLGFKESFYFLSKQRNSTLSDVIELRQVDTSKPKTSEFGFVCHNVVFNEPKDQYDPIIFLAEWSMDGDSLEPGPLYNPDWYNTQNSEGRRIIPISPIELIAHKSKPSNVLYKRQFRINDLNHDNIPECYRYSISNGKLIDVDCYTLVNDGPVSLSREEAERWLQGEFEFRTLLLYSQLRGE
jgi:hypothetical protein